MKQIDLFRQDLEALEVTVVLEGNNFCLEYSIDAVDHKAVTKLINKYVGFWKSIGIEHDHSGEKRIARYRIPTRWITGKDVTEDQLLEISHNISKGIFFRECLFLLMEKPDIKH